MNLSGKLEDAFTSNNVYSAVTAIVDEKSSSSLVDRLDEVACRELQKKEFKNVTLILRAIEQIISKDKDCINKFIHQGLLMKMLNWFEKVSEHLKMQQKPSKAPVQLIEVFYEVSMSLCQRDVEGNNKILELFLLRFGAVVIDQEVKFDLRLEAIKTINSMLDSASKESWKKICQSDDLNFLLDEFAKVTMDVGDYEMQVATSEALCRMTPKKLREELVGKWFNYRSFASTFTAIRVKEFETDCRLFLNELNSYFGKSRRVFSFPCIRAFLDFTELVKPVDEQLKEFWVDFNVGTSCISFYVHNPEGTLWDLIHLPKEGLCTYSLRECDDQKFLSVHMLIPVTNGNISGKMVQIIFDSKHEIQTAVEKVFGEAGNSQLLKTPKHAASLGEDSGIPATPFGSAQKHVSPPASKTSKPQVSFFLQSGPGRLPSPIGRRIGVEDQFSLRNESDTEVTVSENLNHACLTDVSERSQDRKPETITFMTALWRYQVVRAKAAVFSQSLSSNGSVKSLPATLSDPRATQKRKLRSSKDTPPFDYTRKKPRLKSKLKVLPLSSPSSNEDEYLKESTPKHRLLERKKAEGSWWPPSTVHSLDTPHPSREITADSGFHDKPVLEDTVFVDEPDVSIEEHKASNEPELQVASEGTEMLAEKKAKFPLSKLQPRRLFKSTSLESATETMAKALMEEDESETELGSGVISAFNTFKTQLREHFSSRYKRIEAKSLRSLADCQEKVTSLLRTVHNQRLVQLEDFQCTVVQQLGQLEQNCLSLKNIEKETVNFWQSESNTVKAFCDQQQKRLDSLEIKTAQVPETQSKQMDSVSSDAHTSQSTALPASAETEDIDGTPSTVPATTASLSSSQS